MLLLFWTMSSSDLYLLRLNDLRERFFFYETRRLMLDIVVVVLVDIVVVASFSQVALNRKRATFHAIHYQYCMYLRITDRQLRIEARQSTIFD